VRSGELSSSEAVSTTTVEAVPEDCRKAYGAGKKTDAQHGIEIRGENA